MKVNVGCGQSPTQGWTNIDNSFSLRLAAWPTLVKLAASAGLLARQQLDFIEFARRSNIAWADAATALPFPDDSVDAMYSSHMLEHLDRNEAVSFLASAKRALRPGGVIRLVVPDLRLLIDSYLRTGSADHFVESTLLAASKPQTPVQRLSSMVVGGRHHHWMYDAASLCELLTRAGFAEAAMVPAGTTRIPDPGELDLRERESESLYVEAIKP